MLNPITSSPNVLRRCKEKISALRDFIPDANACAYMELYLSQNDFILRKEEISECKEELSSCEDILKKGNSCISLWSPCNFPTTTAALCQLGWKWIAPYLVEMQDESIDVLLPYHLRSIYSEGSYVFLFKKGKHSVLLGSMERFPTSKYYLSVTFFETIE